MYLPWTLVYNFVDLEQNLRERLLVMLWYRRLISLYLVISNLAIYFHTHPSNNEHCTIQCVTHFESGWLVGTLVGILLEIILSTTMVQMIASITFNISKNKKNIKVWLLILIRHYYRYELGVIKVYNVVPYTGSFSYQQI